MSESLWSPGELASYEQTRALRKQIEQDYARRLDEARRVLGDPCRGVFTDDLPPWLKNSRQGIACEQE